MAQSNELPEDAIRRAAERHEEILGQPPRLTPMTSEEAIAQGAVAVYEKIRRNASGNTAPAAVDEIPELVMAVLKHPELFESLSDLSGVLQTKGLLSARDRQLAVLRTTWLWQAPYPFGEHVKHSKRIGISAEEIEQVKIGSRADGWNRHDRALLMAVEELVAGAMVSDSTWAVLAERFDGRELFELTILVGQFTTISYFQNALCMRLRADNPGLLAS